MQVYDGGAKIFPIFFNKTVTSLGCTHVVMGAFMITKKLYIPGGLLIIFGPLMCRNFYKMVNRKFDVTAERMPLEIARQHPPAEVSTDNFLPPALKPNGDEIWHPEANKCWQGLCAPRVGP